MDKYENMIVAKFNREEYLQKKDEEEKEMGQQKDELIKNKIKEEKNSNTQHLELDKEGRVL